MEQRLLKNSPFKCYFCNRIIENESEVGHNSICGAVLEQCQNKCGLYVPRNMKLAHMKECQNKRSSKSISRLENYTTNSLGRVNMKPTNVSTIPEFHIKLDEIYKKFSQATMAFKNQQQEIIQTQHNYHTQSKMALDKLHYQNQILNEWKKTIELKFENLKKEQSLQRVRPVLLSMETNFQNLNEKFYHELEESRKIYNNFQVKFVEIEDYLKQENAVVGALWNDQKVTVENIQTEIGAINKTLSENKAKQSSWIFDIRNIGQIAAETSDKQDIQEKTFESLKKELGQLKIDVALLEESVTNKSCSPMNKNTGRTIWKISDFQSKMESAKADDIVLKSPIFYTHEFGYKIRLELYLNGLKKWKGRHAIMCLNVLKGDYDLLLQWPCLIEGTVILRDLYNRTKKTDYSKYILAKRYSGDEETEEPQESSTQYIFIPHSTLIKQNFIKNDTMFIEILINKVNRQRDETEL